MVWLGLIVAFAPIPIVLGVIYWFYRSYRDQQAEIRRIREAGPEAFEWLKAMRRAQGRQYLITLITTLLSILIIAGPLMLWTSIPSLVITVITASVIILLQFIRCRWEYHRPPDPQLAPPPSLPPKEVTNRTRNLWINRTLIFGVFLFGICALYQGIVWMRVIETIDDWDVTTGVVEVDGRYVRYLYTVEEEEYQGNRISFLGERIDDDLYTDDQEVTVYYDPTNPKNAALLQQGEHGGLATPFIIALLALAFSTYYISTLLMRTYDRFYRTPDK